MARLCRAKEIEADSQNREVRMMVTFVCYSLWVGFWFQFVTGMMYGIPALHTLSGGHWYAPDYEFYLKRPDSVPLSSVAGNFVFYSAFGSALAIFLAWMYTRREAAKWRLRFAVAMFVTITLGWSIAAYRAEEAAWTVGLDRRISKVREMWRMSADWGDDEWRMKSYRLEVEQLEKIRKTRKWVPLGELW